MNSRKEVLLNQVQVQRKIIESSARWLRSKALMEASARPAIMERLELIERQYGRLVDSIQQLKECSDATDLHFLRVLRKLDQLDKAIKDGFRVSQCT